MLDQGAEALERRALGQPAQAHRDGAADGHGGEAVAQGRLCAGRPGGRACVVARRDVLVDGEAPQGRVRAPAEPRGRGRPRALAGETVIAGDSWFLNGGRDIFVAIRGLCIAVGRLDRAEAIRLA